MRAATPDIDAVDGALFDADHDGDLDVWLVNGRGPNELLNNNGDGTFRRIATEAGLAADAPSVTRRRRGRPRRRPRPRPRSSSRHRRRTRCSATTASGSTRRARGSSGSRPQSSTPSWPPTATPTARWSSTPPGLVASSAGSRTRAAHGTPRRSDPPIAQVRRPLAIADVDGDGALDLLAGSDRGWAAWSTTAAGGGPIFDQASSGVTAWAVVHQRSGPWPLRVRPLLGRLARMAARTAASAVPFDRADRSRGRQRSTAVEHVGDRYPTGRAGRITLDCGGHRANRVGPGPEPAAGRRSGSAAAAAPAPTSCRSSGPTASCRPRSISRPAASTASRRRSGSSRAARCCSPSTARPSASSPTSSASAASASSNGPASTARRTRTNGSCCPRRRSPRMTGATR